MKFLAYLRNRPGVERGKGLVRWEPACSLVHVACHAVCSPECAGLVHKTGLECLIDVREEKKRAGLMKSMKLVIPLRLIVLVNSHQR